MKISDKSERYNIRIRVKGEVMGKVNTSGI